MYCRACGNQVSDNDSVCAECGTKIGEGTKFCQTCGFHTSLKTEFCFQCGAKQKTVITQQMKEEKIEHLQKQALSTKRSLKMLRFFMFGSILMTAILFIVLVGRKSPDNIPQPFVVVENEGTIPSNYSVKAPSDFIYYADGNVQEYWMQSRKIISYMVISLFVLIFSFVDSLLHKKRYKKLLNQLKEAKNVL